jgi:hypothetical protein
MGHEFKLLSVVKLCYSFILIIWLSYYIVSYTCLVATISLLTLDVTLLRSWR